MWIFYIVVCWYKIFRWYTAIEAQCWYNFDSKTVLVDGNIIRLLSDIIVAYQLFFFFTYHYRLSNSLKFRDNSHEILINLQPWTTLRSYPRQEFQTRHRRLIATLRWFFKCCLELSPRLLSYLIFCSVSCFWKGRPCWRKDTIFFCLA